MWVAQEKIEYFVSNKCGISLNQESQIPLKKNNLHVLHIFLVCLLNILSFLPTKMLLHPLCFGFACLKKRIVCLRLPPRVLRTSQTRWNSAMQSAKSQGKSNGIGSRWGGKRRAVMVDWKQLYVEKMEIACSIGALVSPSIYNVLLFLDSLFFCVPSFSSSV